MLVFAGRPLDMACSLSHLELGFFHFPDDHITMGRVLGTISRSAFFTTNTTTTTTSARKQISHHFGLARGACSISSQQREHQVSGNRMESSGAGVYCQLLFVVNVAADGWTRLGFSVIVACCFLACSAVAAHRSFLLADWVFVLFSFYSLQRQRSLVLFLVALRIFPLFSPSPFICLLLSSGRFKKDEVSCGVVARDAHPFLRIHQMLIDQSIDLMGYFPAAFCFFAESCF
ncbi:hypothetical protein JOL62DRAFT_85531 [Phyllosticta paracitricarpa]|uniref:Uncharacterized protein n=1 Tax=Phyllosticta paracitricarpa TaxID=2016321 RepID=A0ABR1N721_9PEZI